MRSKQRGEGGVRCGLVVGRLQPSEVSFPRTLERPGLLALFHPSPLLVELDPLKSAPTGDLGFAASHAVPTAPEVVEAWSRGVAKPPLKVSPRVASYRRG